MEPVIVLWADAWGEDSQIDIDSLSHEPVMTYTIGFLLKADEVGVHIAMDTYPDSPSEVRNTAFIPRGMVRDIAYLTRTVYTEAKE